MYPLIVFLFGFLNITSITKYNENNLNVFM